MAIPPDPIEEVLSVATSVIAADVVSAARRAIDVPQKHDVDGVDDGDDGDDDDDSVLAAQDCVLVVVAVFKGSLAVGARVACVKPEGEYELPLGFHGPFLLVERTKPATILGRYGPDSYKLAEVKRALERRR